MEKGIFQQTTVFLCARPKNGSDVVIEICLIQSDMDRVNQR